ncbi:MAG: sulfatase-like hydrolase/transferase, partial [Spirochaetales bacterium]|nr:sulfatase-like hydrolase/transferase [Spirochaetales bacterium]
ADSGVPDNHHNIDPERANIYRRLRQAGYRVGSVGKLDLAKNEQFWGADNSGRHYMERWGFTDGFDSAGKIDAISAYRESNYRPADPYMQFLEEQGVAEAHHDDMRNRQGDPWNVAPSPLNEYQYCDNWIGRSALSVLGSYPTDKPWFLQVNFTGPHDPWDITEEMSTWYQGVQFPPAKNLDRADGTFPEGFSPHRLNAVRRNYAAMVENLDRNVGLLIRNVAERDELDRTVVVFSSDHGEMLGDCGRWYKRSWHEASCRIPLIISHPAPEYAGRRGLDTTHLVQLQDVGATILDIGGAEALAGEGVSILPFLASRTNHTRRIASTALDDWSATIHPDRKEITKRGRGSWVESIDDRTISSL